MASGTRKRNAKAGQNGQPDAVAQTKSNGHAVTSEKDVVAKKDPKNVALTSRDRNAIILLVILYMLQGVPVGLAYHLADPSGLELAASATLGRIVATSLTPNPRIGGFRAALDLHLDGPGTSELRAFLRADGRALSETWSYAWTLA